MAKSRKKSGRKHHGNEFPLIRAARASDAEQLIELAAWWPVGSHLVPRDDQDVIVHGEPLNYLDDPLWCVLVAAAGPHSKLVGYAVGYDVAGFHARLGWPYDAGGLCGGKRVGQLEELYVIKPYQRLGIATTLVRSFEDWARRSGCSACSLAGGPAPRFYSKIGYTRVRVCSFIKEL